MKASEFNQKYHGQIVTVKFNGQVFQTSEAYNQAWTNSKNETCIKVDFFTSSFPLSKCEVLSARPIK